MSESSRYRVVVTTVSGAEHLIDATDSATMARVGLNKARDAVSALLPDVEDLEAADGTIIFGHAIESVRIKRPWE